MSRAFAKRPALNDAQSRRSSASRLARHLRLAPALRRDRQRQDRGVSARDRRGPRARRTSARARARNRAHAAAHRALSRTLRRTAGGPAFGPERRRALGAWRSAREGAPASSSVRARRCSSARATRADRRRRGARRLVQAAGRFRYSARDLAIVRAQRPGCRSCWLGDAVAGNPARARSAAAVAVAAAAARCATRSRRAWR